MPDPAGQGFSPYVYCGNNPLIMVDPDGEFWQFVFGAAINVFTHWDEVKHGNFWDFLGFASVGALGTGLSMIGNPSAWYGFQNIITGAGQGALIGGLNSSLSGNKFSQGLKGGSISGAAFGLISTEQFQNTLRGNLWKSDQQVFEQFASSEDFQGAIDYFGGEGVYDPNNQVFQDHPN